MASITDNLDNDYRVLCRSHFMSRVKNPKLKQKIRDAYLKEPAKPSPHLKEQFCKKQQTNLENTYASLKHFNPPMSGGDADRMLNHSTFAPQDLVDFSRTRHINENLSLKHMHSCTKPFQNSLTADDRPSSRKYQTSAVEDCIDDHNYLSEKDSNLVGVGNNSEDSAKSQKSSKTVVSRKSSQDLKKLVTSQCKLHKVIKETLTEMGVTQVDNAEDNNTCGAQVDPSNLYSLSLSQCKRCSDRFNMNAAQKDVMTEIGKGDFFDCRNTNTLKISVDDIVNSRFINPMIHKLHRMCLNNLKEEMSLMKDLEMLPNQVNDIYRSVILKQKD